MAHKLALALALAACLAAHAAGQLEPFSEAGAPAFLNGAFTLTTNDGIGIAAVGWAKGGKTTTVYPANGTAGGFVTETAEYTSWQCNPAENGTYLALVNVTVNAPGAAPQTTQYCELGVPDLGYGYIDWARSAGKCPTETAGTLTLPEPQSNLVNPCGPIDGSTGGTTSPTSTTTDSAGAATANTNTGATGMSSGTTSQTGLDNGASPPPF